MLKKTSLIMLIFTAIILLSSCRPEERINFSELLRRAAAITGDRAFSMKEVLYDGNERILFIPYKDGEFVLKAEENGNLVDKITFTGLKNGENENIFPFYADALIKAFLYDNTVSIYNNDIIIKGGAEFYTCGRYEIFLLSDKNIISITVTCK